MGNGPWLAVKLHSRPFPHTLRALVTIAALVLIGRTSWADVKLAAADDGQLGAWLIAGPIAASAKNLVDVTRAEPRLGQPIVPGAPTATWRLAATPDGTLDLIRVLRVTRDAGPVAAMGAELVTEHDLTAQLLLSVDGHAQVFLDGRLIWARATPHLRGASWDTVPLQASPGRHRLVLWLQHNGQHWASRIRLLDARTGRAPLGASLLLPGTGDVDSRALEQNLLAGELVTETVGGGFSPRLILRYAAGAPSPSTRQVRVTAMFGATPLFEVRAGEFAADTASGSTLTIQLPTITSNVLPKVGSARVLVRAHIGTAKLEIPLQLSSKALQLSERAARMENALPAGLRDAAAIRDTLRWRQHRLLHATTLSEHALKVAETTLDDLLRSLEAQQDPLAAPGVRTIARRSIADGQLHSVGIHVPASFGQTPDRKYPLILALHGWNGRPSGILTAFLDRAGSAPHPSVDGFVVAPYAHGNSFYRGAGEREVIETLDWMMRTYPIDEHHVSITGVSMGGTGAAHVALRYADRFAAAAPLCGYHSYFVRRDVAGRQVRDFEHMLMHRWSPASFADNGRNLPLHVAHGTKDFPLENSRVLVRRYKQLGYSMRDEWPDVGHAVWEHTYAHAGLWPFLSRAERPRVPQQITLVTDSLRYGAQGWLRISALGSRYKLATADAAFTNPGALRITTSNVTALAVDRGRAELAGNVEVQVDGQTLTFAPGEPVQLLHSQGRWQAGEPERTPARKRPGVEGPFSDVFLEPVLFVYGTANPATVYANRDVATAFARRDTATVSYPVLPDYELTPELERTHAVFAVGTSTDHALLRAISANVTFVVDQADVVAGARRFSGTEVGALFVQPNPRYPERYLAVITAPTTAGLYRALSLPKLLPDFVVYDQAVAAAANEQIFGAAAPLFAGFFDEAWRLPN